MKLYITPVKFYFPYYPKFNALAIQFVTTLPLYHFIIWKCITLPLYIDKAYPVSTRCHMPRMQDALLLPLIAPYSHEKRLHGTLYHNQRKPLKNAFKHVTSLCPFYRTCKISFIYLTCMLHLVLYALFTIVIALIRAFYIFIDTFIIYK